MPPRVKVIAHRGCGAAEPENTLRAIRRALELGVDGVEIDVHACRSGEIVVIHDPTVDRTTNGTGSVAQLSLHQLRELDAGKGERIPTLREVLELVAGRPLILNIEVKVPGIGRQVLDLVHGYEAEHQVIISSFLYPVLTEIRQLDQEITTGLLYMHQELGDPVKIAKELEANALHPHHSLVTANLVERCRHAGLLINPWTVNEEKDLHRLLSLGVDGIITDYLQLLQSLLSPSKAET